MKTLFTILFVVTFRPAVAQSDLVGQIAVWKPKDGFAQHFEKGYKQHLKWHQVNGDPWSWYGWFIISGPRYGQFVDATFDHSWADLDQSIKPAEDLEDNRLHVIPFADVQNIFKISYLPEYSTADTFAGKLKLVKLITINVDDTGDGLHLIGRLKDHYISKQIKSFKAYTVIDGGHVNQLLLMLGFTNWKEYGASEDFNHVVSEYQESREVKTAASIIVETMTYRPDLSYFPK